MNTKLAALTLTAAIAAGTTALTASTASAATASPSGSTITMELRQGSFCGWLLGQIMTVESDWLAHVLIDVYVESGC